MKIAIDVSQIHADRTGIEYYTHELLKALIQLEKDTNSTIVLVTNKREYVSEYETHPHVHIHVIEHDQPNFRWILKVAWFLRRRKIDILISPSFFTFSLLFPRTIQIIHDVIPITHPEYWPQDAARSFKRQLRLATVFAKHFVTISETTKQELIRLFPRTEHKTTYIGIGLHEWTLIPPSPEEIQATKKKYDLPEEYIISVSTLQPRKNYVHMIQGFAEYHKENKNMHYVIVGRKGWYYEPIFEIVKDLEIEQFVHFLGYVPEADLPALYAQSNALLMCSYAEGFGLPAIEAYVHGVPSVLSDIPVFRESMQGNAYYIKANRSKDIGLAIQKAVQSTLKIESTFISQYSWNSVAKRLQKIYRSATGE